MSRTLSAAELPGLVRPGMRIYVEGGVGEPRALIAALQAGASLPAGLRFVQSVLPGLNGTDFTTLGPGASMEVFMLSGPLQQAYREGRIDYVPIRLRALADHLARGPAFDLALVQVAPTAEPGVYSAGLNADLLESVLDNAHLVVAEVNERMPAPPGALRVSGERLDVLIPSSEALPPYPLAEPSQESADIGRLVANLVKDGDCVQTGIGSIPFAVLSALREKNDLGLHSGLVDDGVMMLAERGVLTGRRKNIDRGRMVVCMAIGTQALYDWCGTRGDLDIRGVQYTHAHQVLAQIDHFVSINSAIEVDCLGQINAEMIGGRQIAGVGGSIDFMWGASASRGGRSIIALSATAAGGKASRIVPMLQGPNAATAPRTEIDTVVTEYGVAELKHLPVRARGERLIEIAAPQFRAELRDRWREMRGLL